MAARHSKIKKNRRRYSESELQKRRYHSDVRKFKEWCKENAIRCKLYHEANLDDVCVLSNNEYDLHDLRKYIEEDNESYFLNPIDYEKWCEEE